MKRTVTQNSVWLGKKDPASPLIIKEKLNILLKCLPPGKGAGTATGFGKIVTKACVARMMRLNM